MNSSYLTLACLLACVIFFFFLRFAWLFLFSIDWGLMLCSCFFFMIFYACWCLFHDFFMLFYACWWLVMMISISFFMMMIDNDLLIIVLLVFHECEVKGCWWLCCWAFFHGCWSMIVLLWRRLYRDAAMWCFDRNSCPFRAYWRQTWFLWTASWRTRAVTIAHRRRPWEMSSGGPPSSRYGAFIPTISTVSATTALAFLL